MKIAFFSEDIGKYSGFSALIMSVMICENFSLNTIMMQNKSTLDGLENCLEASKRKSFFREESSYFALDGLDFLIWLYQNRRITWSAVEEVALPLYDKAKFIPAGMREQSRLYPEKTGDAQWDIVRWLDKMTDVVVVDCGFTDDVFSRHLREKGEVKVICVKHEKEAVERVLIKEKKWFGDEIILLVDYDYRSVYNKENISRIYRIPEERIAAIPRNLELENYLTQGKLQKYFKKNKNPVIGYRNFYYMREIKEASEKIMEAAYGKVCES